MSNIQAGVNEIPRLSPSEQKKMDEEFAKLLRNNSQLPGGYPAPRGPIPTPTPAPQTNPGLPQINTLGQLGQIFGTLLPTQQMKDLDQMMQNMEANIPGITAAIAGISKQFSQVADVLAKNPAFKNSPFAQQLNTAVKEFADVANAYKDYTECTNPLTKAAYGAYAARQWNEFKSEWNTTADTMGSVGKIFKI